MKWLKFLKTAKKRALDGEAEVADAHSKRRSFQERRTSIEQWHEARKSRTSIDLFSAPQVTTTEKLSLCKAGMTTLINRTYIVIKHLGSGSSGQVKLAFNLRSKKLVAIKAVRKAGPGPGGGAGGGGGRDYRSYDGHSHGRVSGGGGGGHSACGGRGLAPCHSLQPERSSSGAPAPAPARGWRSITPSSLMRRSASYAARDSQQCFGASPASPSPGRDRLAAAASPAPPPPEDFVREIAILKRLAHPNIVQLLEVIDDPGSDCLLLVMGYVEGATLQPPPRGPGRWAAQAEQEVWRHARDVLAGLEYLHCHGVVHGDLKPANFIQDSLTGLVRILDFGSAVLHSRGLGPGGEEGLRGAHVPLSCTPGFRSPESLVAGYRLSFELDMWSLGVCLYMWVYGELPFKGSAPFVVYENIRSAALAMPSHTRISAQLTDLITRLLDKDPRSRMTVQEAVQHPWVTAQGLAPLRTCSPLALQVRLQQQQPQQQQPVAQLTYQQQQHLCLLEDAARRVGGHQQTAISTWEGDSASLSATGTVAMDCYEQLGASASAAASASGMAAAPSPADSSGPWLASAGGASGGSPAAAAAPDPHWRMSSSRLQSLPALHQSPQSPFQPHVCMWGMLPNIAEGSMGSVGTIGTIGTIGTGAPLSGSGMPAGTAAAAALSAAAAAAVAAGHSNGGGGGERRSSGCGGMEAWELRRSVTDEELQAAVSSCADPTGGAAVLMESIFSEVTFPAKQQIIRAGDPLDRIYLITAGEVEIYHDLQQDGPDAPCPHKPLIEGLSDPEAELDDPGDFLAIRLPPGRRVAQLERLSTGMLAGLGGAGGGAAAADRERGHTGGGTGPGPAAAPPAAGGDRSNHSLHGGSGSSVHGAGAAHAALAAAAAAALLAPQPHAAAAARNSLLGVGGLAPASTPGAGGGGGRELSSSSFGFFSRAATQAGHLIVATKGPGDSLGFAGCAGPDGSPCAAASGSGRQQPVWSANVRARTQVRAFAASIASLHDLARAHPQVEPLMRHMAVAQETDLAVAEALRALRLVGRERGKAAQGAGAEGEGRRQGAELAGREEPSAGASRGSFAEASGLSGFGAVGGGAGTGDGTGTGTAVPTGAHTGVSSEGENESTAAGGGGGRGGSRASPAAAVAALVSGLPERLAAFASAGAGVLDGEEGGPMDIMMH